MQNNISKAYLITLNEYLSIVAPLLKEFKSFLKKNPYFISVGYGGYILFSYPELLEAKNNKQNLSASFNFSDDKINRWQTIDEELEYQWNYHTQRDPKQKEAPAEVIAKKNEYISKFNEIFDDKYVSHSLADADNSKSNKRSIRYAIDSNIYVNLLESQSVDIDLIRNVAESASVKLPKKIIESMPSDRLNEEKYEELYKTLPSINRDKLKGLVGIINDSMTEFVEQLFLLEKERSLKDIDERKALLEISYQDYIAFDYAGVFEPLKRPEIRIETTKYRDKRGYDREKVVTYFKAPSLTSNWEESLDKGIRQWIESLKRPLFSSIIYNFTKISEPIKNIGKLNISTSAGEYIRGEFRFEFENGSSFDYDARAITAGGYNIQRYHFRYITDFVNIVLVDGTKLTNASLYQIVENFSTKEQLNISTNPYEAVRTATDTQQIIDRFHEYIKTHRNINGQYVEKIRKDKYGVSFKLNYHNRYFHFQSIDPDKKSELMPLEEAKEKAIKNLQTYGIKEAEKLEKGGGLQSCNLKEPYTAKQIATKYDITVEEAERLLREGAIVEREHSNDDSIATTIASQHLWENKDYYIKLEKMEETFEDGGNIKISITKSVKFSDEKTMPKNVRENLDKGSKITIEQEAKLSKEYWKTLDDGTVVYFVDGEYIRGKKGEDPISIEFTQGGHGYVYPNYIPYNPPEIWIDDNNRKEAEPILLHEVTERNDMRDNGTSYSDAHEKANAKETEFRKGDYDEKICKALDICKKYTKKMEQGGKVTDCRSGCLANGDSHAEGGIKATIPEDKEKRIEIEGKEFVIIEDAVNDKEIHTYTGNNREILSKINQSGGGVSLMRDSKEADEVIVSYGQVVITKGAIADKAEHTYTGTNKEILSQINEGAGGKKILSDGGCILEEGGGITNENESKPLSIAPYNVIKSKHTKTGADIWVVTMKERYDLSTYRAIESKIKQSGGFWSGFVKGFLFKNEPNADILDNVFGVATIHAERNAEIPQSKRGIIPFNEANPHETVNRGILKREWEAGKMLAGAYKHFDGMRDMDVYVDDIKYFSKGENEYVDGGLDRDFTSSYDNARSEYSTKKITLGNYYLKYKPDIIITDTKKPTGLFSYNYYVNVDKNAERKEIEMPSQSKNFDLPNGTRVRVEHYGKVYCGTIIGSAISTTTSHMWGSDEKKVDKDINYKIRLDNGLTSTWSKFEVSEKCTEIEQPLLKKGDRIDYPESVWFDITYKITNSLKHLKRSLAARKLEKYRISDQKEIDRAEKELFANMSIFLAWELSAPLFVESVTGENEAEQTERRKLWQEKLNIQPNNSAIYVANIEKENLEQGEDSLNKYLAEINTIISKYDLQKKDSSNTVFYMYADKERKFVIRIEVTEKGIAAVLMLSFVDKIESKDFTSIVELEAYLTESKEKYSNFWDTSSVDLKNKVRLPFQVTKGANYLGLYEITKHNILFLDNILANAGTKTTVVLIATPSDKKVNTAFVEVYKSETPYNSWQGNDFVRTVKFYDHAGVMISKTTFSTYEGTFGSGLQRYFWSRAWKFWGTDIKRSEVETQPIIEPKADELSFETKVEPRKFDNVADYKNWIEETKNVKILDLTEAQIIEYLKELSLSQLSGKGGIAMGSASSKDGRVEKIAQMMIYQFANTVPEDQLTLEQYAIKQFIKSARTEAGMYSEALYVPIEDYRTGWERAKAGKPQDTIIEGAIDNMQNAAKPEIIETPKEVILDKSLKKDILFLLGLQQAKDKGERTEYNIDLFKSSLLGKLKTMQKNGKQDEVNEALKYLRRVAVKNNVSLPFTDNHSIWELESKAVTPEVKIVSEEISIPNQTDADVLDIAEDMGEEAFKNGIERVPLKCKLFREAFIEQADRPMGDTRYYDAWYKGWDKANLRAPVPEAKEDYKVLPSGVVVFFSKEAAERIIHQSEVLKIAYPISYIGADYTKLQLGESMPSGWYGSQPRQGKGNLLPFKPLTISDLINFDVVSSNTRPEATPVKKELSRADIETLIKGLEIQAKYKPSPELTTRIIGLKTVLKYKK